MSREIELQLTALHPSQMQVLQQAKRFNVVCCGRRWGKTVLGMDRLIHPALEGKPVAWFAPNYRLLTDVWRELNATLAPIITRTNQQPRRSARMTHLCSLKPTHTTNRICPRLPAGKNEQSAPP